MKKQPGLIHLSPNYRLFSGTRLFMSLFILFAYSSIAGGQNPNPSEKPTITKIAFGSCAVQNRPQPIWDAVNKWHPDIFIFAGDNIYGDTENMDTLRAKYQQLGSKPGYQKLMEQTNVLATWDDHDYGANDAGSWYPKKEESEQLFLDFFDEPENSPRRARPGIYHSYRFGPEGRRVQIILLDTRYFRDRFETRTLTDQQDSLGYGPYIPNTDSTATMLGEDQWSWLAEQLDKPSDLRLIVSSIQVVSGEHGWELWAHLPHEKQRLYRLIEEKKAGGVIFLSGDVHWAELSRYEDNAYPLYDLTSSALNQNWIQALNLPNNQRVGQTVYPYPNFGTIEINWNATDPVVTLGIHDINGYVILKRRIRLNQLQHQD